MGLGGRSVIHAMRSHLISVLRLDICLVLRRSAQLFHSRRRRLCGRIWGSSRPGKRFLLARAGGDYDIIVSHRCPMSFRAPFRPAIGTFADRCNRYGSPLPHQKGRAVATFWIIFNLGGMIGAFIAFGQNYGKNVTGTISNSTYWGE